MPRLTEMHCSRCDSVATLVSSWDADVFVPVNGWYFTTDTGWLCPLCVIDRDNAMRAEDV